MATINYSAPNKNLTPLISVSEESKISNEIKLLKNSAIYPIVEKCAENSNVPKELIYSLIYTLSNGKNNPEFKTNEFPRKLNRSGYFSLSQKIAKIILLGELGNNRLSIAERQFLNEYGNTALKNYILPEKGTKSFNQHWLADLNVGSDRVSDSLNPFNLLTPEVSIAIGTIWIGQVVDKYSEQTSTPIDKVLITMLLPYNGWLGGNDFCKNKLWTIDYTALKNFERLPRPENLKAPSNIINPNGGYVGKALATILAGGGTLDYLTKKRA